MRKWFPAPSAPAGESSVAVGPFLAAPQSAKWPLTIYRQAGQKNNTCVFQTFFQQGKKRGARRRASMSHRRADPSRRQASDHGAFLVDRQSVIARSFLSHRESSPCFDDAAERFEWFQRRHADTYGVHTVHDAERGRNVCAASFERTMERAMERLRCEAAPDDASRSSACHVARSERPCVIQYVSKMNPYMYC